MYFQKIRLGFQVPAVLIITLDPLNQLEKINTSQISTENFLQLLFRRRLGPNQAIILSKIDEMISTKRIYLAGQQHYFGHKS